MSEVFKEFLRLKREELKEAGVIVGGFIICGSAVVAASLVITYWLENDPEWHTMYIVCCWYTGALILGLLGYWIRRNWQQAKRNVGK